MFDLSSVDLSIDFGHYLDFYRRNNLCDHVMLLFDVVHVVRITFIVESCELSILSAKKLVMSVLI